MTHSITFRRSTSPPRLPRRARLRRLHRRRNENPRRDESGDGERPASWPLACPGQGLTHRCGTAGPDPASPAGGAPGIARFVAVDLKLAGGSLPSAAGLDWLDEKGYRTLVDLRESSETDSTFIAEVSRRGLRYIALPISLKTIDREHLARFNFELALGDARPLYFFDRDGDRAGTLWYIRRITVDRVNPRSLVARPRNWGSPTRPTGTPPPASSHGRDGDVPHVPPRLPEPWGVSHQPGEDSGQSAGTGATTVIASSRVGCVKVSSGHVAAIRDARPRHPGRVRAPYLMSPTIGSPRPASWTRNWWLRPVSRSQFHLGESSSPVDHAIRHAPPAPFLRLDPGRRGRGWPPVLLEHVDPLARVCERAPPRRWPSRPSRPARRGTARRAGAAALLVRASRTTPEVGRSSRWTSPTNTLPGFAYRDLQVRRGPRQPGSGRPSRRPARAGPRAC